jgi:hypothetical protein
MLGGSVSRRDVVHLCALGALAAYFMVWPVWRAQFPIEIWFTESWNAYHQDAAAAGFRLYPKADEFVVNNYPPLSFFAIGALGKVLGDSLFVGRVVSIIGLLAIAAEIALVVRLLTGALLGGILGALWFVAIMAHNFTSYVGANDPQIAGLAIMGAALVWFLQRDMDGKAPEPALLLMVVAGFWKHNIIGIPLTAVTFLILRDRRSAIRPVLVSAAAAGAGLLLCSVIFGNVFIENLLTPRDYRLSNLLGQIGHLQWVALALVIWGIWAVIDRSKAAGFTALLVGWGLFSCLLQWLGHGVFGNAEFDLIMAAGIGIGAALARTKSGFRRDVVIVLLAIRLLGSTRQESAEVLIDPAFRASFYAAEKSRAAMTAQVAAIPGPVFCKKDNLLCRRAGKEFVVDDFKTDQMVATGKFSEADVEELIRNRGITIFESGPPLMQAGVKTP